MRPSVQHTPLDPTKNFRGKHILFLFWPSVTSHYLVEETPPDDIGALAHTYKKPAMMHTFTHTHVLSHMPYFHVRTYVCHTHTHIYIHTFICTCTPTFHMQLCHTQSSTTSFVFPSFLRPRYNIWCSLLEEVDLWGYPVL